MQPFGPLLIIPLVVVNLVAVVSGQQHVHDRSMADRQDDPTAMAASLGDHQKSRTESNMNVASSSHEQDSDWQVNLDLRQSINLGWSLDRARNEVLFTLKMNLTRTKFRLGSDIFALGFSDYGQIESADFCLLYFNLAHSAQMRDAITNSVGQLNVLDKRNSYCKLANHLNHDNHLLVFKFTRPLDTCQTNYYAIDNGTTHLVWFKMDGPVVVDMNEINLSELQQQHQNKQTTGFSSFESGLTRVQLAATKVKTRRKSNSHHSSSSLDVRMENYAIPTRETTYWCKLFKLPHRFEQRKFHITKYEAVIEQGNEHIVHHMELFNCVHETAQQTRDLRELYEQKGGWSGECGAKDRPQASKICRRVIMAWAMGAKPLEYPEQVGQSIGGHKYSPYVVLEVHYNNVELRQGSLDNSGLRFHFTHKLRPFDAGIMEVGLEYTDKNSIPPNVIAPLAGYCVSECTRAAMSGPELVSGSTEHDYGSRLGHHGRNNDLEDEQDDQEEGEGEVEEEEEEAQDPVGRYLEERTTNNSKGREQEIHKQEEGIHIFAAQMHTHLAGVASWTEQIREGRLLRELQRDNHYSPHFQEIRLLPEPIHLAPGDSLIHYCLYDTRQRRNITLGGFATSDEMCVTYLHYYPRIELEVCKSSVDSRALDEYFVHLASQENQLAGLYNLSSSSRISAGSSTKLIADKLKEKSASEKYQSIEWSQRRSRELLEFYANGPLSVQCNRSNGDRFPGFWNGVTPTKVYWTNNDHDHDKQGGQPMAGDRAASYSKEPSLGALDQDDPRGRRLAGGHPTHWGPQIMQYRGQPRPTTRPFDWCSLASLHKQRLQLV